MFHEGNSHEYCGCSKLCFSVGIPADVRLAHFFVRRVIFRDLRSNPFPLSPIFFATR